MRIGPNPANQPSAHWFTGLGMVHGVRLAEGHADWYRSRYVRAGRGSRTLGIPVVAGPGSESDFNVNTTVLHLGDGVYACVEAGATPVHLSYELESLSRSDLGGATRGFAAHAKRDPLTGETIAIAYQAGRPTVQYLVVGVDGVARQRAEIAIPHMPLIHDVAITQSSVVVLDMPVTFDMAKVKPGNFPFSWNTKQGARVGLLPRDGDVTKLQWFEAPKSFVFHCFNSYDDGDKVVLDVVKHPRMFASGKTDISEGAPAVSRWILDRKTGQLSETIVDDRGAEFPRVNDARESLAYRFGYSASADSRGKLGPIMKYDMQTARLKSTTSGRGGRRRSRSSLLGRAPRRKMMDTSCPTCTMRGAMLPMSLSWRRTISRALPSQRCTCPFGCPSASTVIGSRIRKANGGPACRHLARSTVLLDFGLAAARARRTMRPGMSRPIAARR